MSSSPVASWSLALLFLAWAVVLLLAAWGCLALWYQATGGRAIRALAALLWATVSCAALMALGRARPFPALLVFGVAFGALLLWWRHLRPTNARDWADDVAQMTTGDVVGCGVTLHNVRNFQWRTLSDYTERWETRTYDLQQLSSVDLILSYWSSRAIAHLLVSFGFADDEHVVFSVEVRRPRRGQYSELGGVFKEFCLSIIAADERDIIRVRTNVRGEDDYLYRIRLPPATMRSLFLEYVNQANKLVAAPRFYNTLTVNCTTLVYHMMKHVVGYVPWDYRLLLSGYLPTYLYRVRALDMRYPLAELRAFGRITERAKAQIHTATFSADIRKGVPELGTSAS